MQKARCLTGPIPLSSSADLPAICNIQTKCNRASDTSHENKFELQCRLCQKSFGIKAPELCSGYGTYEGKHKTKERLHITFTVKHIHSNPLNTYTLKYIQLCTKNGLRSPEMLCEQQNMITHQKEPRNTLQCWERNRKVYIFYDFVQKAIKLVFLFFFIKDCFYD